MAFDFDDGDDYYAVLETDNSASYDDLKKQHQKLILKYHPDKADTCAASEEKDRAVEKFVKINKAWKVLSDERTRKEYDAKRYELKTSQSWPVNSEVDLDDMQHDEENDLYIFHCRCGGEHRITEDDMIQGVDIVCCSTCTLSIKVLYQLQDED